MSHISINGESQALPDGETIASLIDRLGLRGKRLAVELNGTIVPRSRHADQQLTDGDRIEIVHAVGGG
jgi:sulfur carrier protein